MACIWKGSGNSAYCESGDGEFFSCGLRYTIAILWSQNVMRVVSAATTSHSAAWGASDNKEMLLIIS